MSDNSTDASTLVERALRRVDADMGVAECHGVLAGWLCAARSLSREQWLTYIAPELAAGDVLAQEAGETLEGLRQAVVAQLNDPELDFQPLVPTDDEPLVDRVEALGEWCQGFLLGMSLGGLKDVAKLPGDAGEALRDLVQLSRAGSYDVGGSEEDEEAYTELLEYVRTAVLLVNEELNPTRAAPQMEPTLH